MGAVGRSLRERTLLTCNDVYDETYSVGEYIYIEETRKRIEKSMKMGHTEIQECSMVEYFDIHDNLRRLL